MKKSLVGILILLFFLPACGNSQKKAKSANYRKGTHSKKYYRTSDYQSLEDIIYDSLEHDRGTGVHYSRYIKQNREFDLPVVRNVYVDKWIDYFTGRGRHHMERYLARAGRFIPYIHSVLEQYGMPKDIAYLSLIESGFNIRAKSWASAVGPWQFIRSTGAMYGLNVDYYVDERRDVQKSTHAAARHLKDLYNMFGDWYLAFAAYNAGPGKVKGAIRRDGNDYWDMVRGRYLRQETKDYVPKLLAAAIIAKDPERYGFRNINYQMAIPYEVVHTAGPTDLEVAAQCAGVNPDLIRLLNPELLRDMTPPNQPRYALKVPRGTKARFQKRYASLKPSQRVRILYYTTDRGDTVKEIARQYGVSEKDLAEANPGAIDVSKKRYTKKVKIRYKRKGRWRTRWKRKRVTTTSYTVAAGQRLSIPKNRSLASYESHRDDAAAYRAEERFGNLASNDYEEPKKENKKDKKKKEKKQEKQEKLIAKAPPQPAPQSDLAITPPPRSDLSDIGYIVRENSGPTLSPLAMEDRPSGTTVGTNSEPTDAEMKQAVAGLRPKSDQPDLTGDPEAVGWVPEEKLPEKKAPQRAPEKPKYHVVKRGETLRGISRQFGVSMSQLKDWNGKKVSPVLLRGAKIRVGGAGSGGSTQVAARSTPKAPPKSDFYKVQSGDTLSGIARKFRVSTAKLKTWNGEKVSPVLKAGAKIRVGGTQVVKYKVRPGDNLTKIAQRHSTTPAKIKKMNGLKSNVIMPGAVLTVRRD